VDAGRSEGRHRFDGEAVGLDRRRRRRARRCAGRLASGHPPSPSTLTFGVAVGDHAPQKLRLTNRGTIADSASLVATGVDDDLTITIEPASVLLAPGESADVTITLTQKIATPYPSESGFSRVGRILIATNSSTATVPWLLITGNVVVATYTGDDPGFVVLARDGGVLNEACAARSRQRTRARSTSW
jgi:hypothetical protein